MHNFFEVEHETTQQGVSPEDDPEKDPAKFIASIHFRDGEVPLSEKFPREVVELVAEDKVVREALAKILAQRGEEDIKHAVRMAGMVIATAEQMDFSADDRKLLLRAALVHDVGKIGIPPEILNKPGKLTDEETEKVHEHVRIGWNFVKNLGKTKEDEALAEIVIRHHEVKGYPRSGRDRREIKHADGTERRVPKPEHDRLARLLSVLDVFDSLGSRPYNENKTAQQILTERKAELKDLNKPEEENLIALLEGREIDPQYILQKSIGETTSGLSAQTSV